MRNRSKVWLVIGGLPFAAVLGTLALVRPPLLAIPVRTEEGHTAGCRAAQNPQSVETQATVYLFLSLDCPISNRTLPELNRLHADFAGRGIRLVGVFAGKSAPAADAAARERDYRIDFPHACDTGYRLTEQLGATHTPQAVVVDRDGNLAYSGRVNDRFADLGRRRTGPVREDLRVALEALLVDQRIDVPRTKPIGCLITAAKSSASQSGVTYCRDVAPILFEHCANCHRPGEAAPFSLLTYEDAQRHAAQIGVVVERGLMPPWKAAANYGRFQNERRLAPEEKRVMQEWIDAGAPRGDPDDLPPQPDFADGWQLGPPDLELEMTEAFDVPADGDDVYQHFVIPTRLAEDRLVTAFEFRPGDPQVVHHATIYLDTTGAARELDAADPGPGYERLGSPGFAPSGWLGGWGPGGLPRKLPPRVGRLIWKGADLVVQIHYHPIGKAARDRSRVGLYFAPRSAGQVATELIVANVDLEIPGGARRHLHRAEYTLPVETILLDVTPHMHVLGRETRVTATRPDGVQVPLIWIKDWDFYWQDHYVFAEPIKLPAGTRIELECWYDNSKANPLNPHSPPRTVYWGDYSADEMGICYFQVTTERWEDFLELTAHSQAYYDNLWQRYQRQKKLRFP